ncbi:MAG: hypothetical protein H0W50_01365 [Parachlamydiaceae bacterium]|nr:hypothetical protein [Parachlamydiaceae bacterium]
MNIINELASERNNFINERGILTSAVGEGNSLDGYSRGISDRILMKALTNLKCYDTIPPEFYDLHRYAVNIEKLKVENSFRQRFRQFFLQYFDVDKVIRNLAGAIFAIGMGLAVLFIANNAPVHALISIAIGSCAFFKYCTFSNSIPPHYSLLQRNLKSCIIPTKNWLETIETKNETRKARLETSQQNAINKFLETQKNYLNEYSNDKYTFAL